MRYGAPPRKLVLRDLFKYDLAKRRELIALREQGMSTPRLGRHFDVDRTTIRYNILRFAPHLLRIPHLIPKTPHYDTPPKAHRETAREMRQRRRLLIKSRLPVVVGPTTPCVLLLPAAPPPPPSPGEKYAYLIEEECVRVNPGKSYAEYRRDSRKKIKVLRDSRAVVLTEQFKERIARRGTLLTKADRRKFAEGFMRKTRMWPAPKL